MRCQSATARSVEIESRAHTLSGSSCLRHTTYPTVGPVTPTCPYGADYPEKRTTFSSWSSYSATREDAIRTRTTKRLFTSFLTPLQAQAVLSCSSYHIETDSDTLSARIYCEYRLFVVSSQRFSPISCVDAQYPPVNRPAVGESYSQWSVWSATCRYTERTHQSTRYTAMYPAAHVPAPKGYYHRVCYVHCNTFPEQDLTSSTPCAMCTRVCLTCGSLYVH
jgi:hypothetical protein